MARMACMLLVGVVMMVDAVAATYPLPPDGQSLIGQLQETRVQEGETLLDIARRYSVGLDEIQNANPDVDPWLPEVGQRIVIPSQYLLPDGPRAGIVVNLPELRLYYYPDVAAGVPRKVMTYPLGIGSEGRAMPVAVTKIIEKKVDPPWVVPDSILAEHEAEGDPLPKVVPPGPDNPLGRYALRLGLSSFLIHSTNHPYSVGMRISHGCLRMYPENIEELFSRVGVGTTVRIIDQPYKAGWQDGVLYLEAHPPLVENGHSPDTNLTPMVVSVTGATETLLNDHAWQAAAQVATRGSGIPAPIYARSQEKTRGGGDGVVRIESDLAERWMVQVGVFRNLNTVEHVKGMMRKMNLPVVANAAGASHPCRILVGPFSTRAAAANAGDKIFQDTGLENFLVPNSRITGIACR